MLPELDRILVMLDQDGVENYEPFFVPLDGGSLVEELRRRGKDVDYLLFEDEGHDVLKLPNRERCYDANVEFFSAQLAP